MQPLSRPRLEHTAPYLMAPITGFVSGSLGLTVPSAVPATGVVQRDGTVVVDRFANIVVDQRP
jgi:hypothetical protein